MPTAVAVHLAVPVDLAAHIFDGLVDDPALEFRRAQVPPHVDVGCELVLADAVMRQSLRGDVARDGLDVVTPARRGHKLTPPRWAPQAVRYGSYRTLVRR